MSAEVQEFLAELRPPVRKVAVAARALILASLGEAQESVDFGNRLLVYQLPATDGLPPVLELRPCRCDVELRFSQGAKLPDPERLLAGMGPLCRHLRLETVEEASRYGVQALVNEAVALARSLVTSHPA